jgi:hypothetical protein
LKSGKELMGSVEGGIKNPESTQGDFRGSSKVGQQHKVENKVLKTAVKTGGVIVMEGRNVLTGQIQTVEVSAADYQSEVLTYEDVRPN